MYWRLVFPWYNYCMCVDICPSQYHQYFLQSFFHTESTKYQTFPWFSIFVLHCCYSCRTSNKGIMAMYYQDQIKSVVMFCWRLVHIISFQARMSYCCITAMCHMHYYFCRTFLWQTVHQWIRGASQAYAVVQQPITTSDWFVSVFWLRTVAVTQTVMPELNLSIILELYQSVSVATNRCMCACVCLSAPGFTLGSASGQTVCSLPGTIHQGEGLTTTLLHRRIQHFSVGKVNLCIVTIYMRVQPDGRPVAALVGFKILNADILGQQVLQYYWFLSP